MSEPTPTQSQIKAEITLVLPDDRVVVDKAYFEKLQDFKNYHSLHGQVWGFSDLERVTRHKRSWIMRHILTPFEKKLSTANGGPVRYPTPGTSETYSIDAERMADFLSLHFRDIYENKL
ncbi:hypothetical protein [Lactobacillus paracasei] [Lactiplantibacillus mudanjiangensis]|uniref:DUF771 domain-containing protein n=1 Tax=Lactiplantibacillus mudanjiangensis TaxID=1296538 RepID=UPI001015AE31|nr:hypothetical protein [Lactobacillus paracasei] [Lactiplantibacillus mudanjiangensis]